MIMVGLDGKKLEVAWVTKLMTRVIIQKEVNEQL